MKSLWLLLVVVIAWNSCVESDEYTGHGGNNTSFLLVPSSGPTVCLPLDEYIQLRDGNRNSTNAPPPTSSAQSGVSSSTSLLLYRYMSPLWLETHANFTVRPSSVSAQTLEVSGTGRNVIFKVKLFEAGALDDDKAYSIQIGFFFTHPPAVSLEPLLQICDGDYCAGFWYWFQDRAGGYGSTESGSVCNIHDGSDELQLPQSTTRRWNIRLEIHPNSTSGITYVSTSSLAYEYSTKLKPSRGLHFRVCGDDLFTYQFHLFEVAVHLNE
ncbi:uncharacterized protein [Oscarella lobularis]|uniref:uncharacterized protein n=1 Tax=Oscarella lobularis TaxID=121494 RepID=UPI003313E934